MSLSGPNFPFPGMQDLPENPRARAYQVALRAKVIKLVLLLALALGMKASVCLYGKPFQPGLIFLDKSWGCINKLHFLHNLRTGPIG